MFIIRTKQQMHNLCSFITGFIFLSSFCFSFHFPVHEFLTLKNIWYEKTIFSDREKENYNTYKYETFSPTPWASSPKSATLSTVLGILYIAFEGTLHIYIAYAHFISLYKLSCNNYGTSFFPLLQEILYTCRVYFCSFCNIFLTHLKLFFNLNLISQGSVHH